MNNLNTFCVLSQKLKVDGGLSYMQGCHVFALIQ